MRVPLVVVLVALTGCDKPTVPPGEAIDVAIMPASYHENSDAPGEVKTKCKFHQKIAEEIVEAAPGSQLSTHNSGKILTMEVVTMHGVDPSSAGDRTVILTGEFTEGGVRTGNFHIRRSAPSGVFGGMPGVCASLDEIAETMAYDIAQWLRDPEENSDLDEAE